MKITKVALYGHYDSRGGTYAVKMEEGRELSEVHKRVDKEFFHIEDDFGYSAAEQDFIRVIELAHEDDLVSGNEYDLWYSNGSTAVVADSPDVDSITRAEIIKVDPDTTRKIWSMDYDHDQKVALIEYAAKRIRTVEPSKVNAPDWGDDSFGFVYLEV